MASTSSITINGTKYYLKDQYLRNETEKKQDPLTAGKGITIEENVISLNKAEAVTVVEGN